MHPPHCMSCKLEGESSKEFLIWHLAIHICTAPHVRLNSPPLKKCHFHRRGQVDFKNVLPMLHEKHKKMCFSRSMGSTFSTFATPPQRNDHFFLAIYTAEGCQKWQNVILPLHEKQKKLCFLRSTRIKFLIFVTPLDWFWRFFGNTPGSGRFWPALAGIPAVLSQNGRIWSPPTRAGGQDDGS